MVRVALHLVSSLVIVLLVAGGGLARAERSSNTVGTVGPEVARSTVFWSVVDLFRDFYWDPEHLDWDAWAERYRDAALEAQRRAAFDSVMSRMVAEVDDDHSRWLGLAARPGEPLFEPVGEEGGEGDPGADDPGGAGAGDPTLTRGLGLQVRYLTGTGVVVERVLPGTPAAEAGLRRGDVIQAIADSDLTGAGPSAVGLVMAESLEAAEVHLSVLRGGRQRFDLTLTPRLLPHATLELTASASMLEDGVAYLYLPSFTLAGTGQLAHALLAELERSGASTYVLDLRGNLGGSIAELGILMGAFYDGEWARALARGNVAWHATFERQGPFGTALLVDDTGRVIRSADVAQPVKLDAPLVVIVDRLTSSAAEVAAAVLQASGRATVVGAATSGNVEVVQGFELADGSSVLIAVANLEMPDGAPLNDGIEPDDVATATVRELARGHDAALASAVAQLSGLPFTPGRWF